MGELMSVLDPALSSSPRPRATIAAGARGESRPGDSFANNEVRLLLNVLAYNLVHAARVLMEKATGQAGASPGSASDPGCCRVLVHAAVRYSCSAKARLSGALCGRGSAPSTTPT